MAIIRSFPNREDCSCARGFYNPRTKGAIHVQNKPNVISKISNIQTHRVVWKSGKY